MEKITRSYLTRLTYHVNGAAIEIHKALGPGLLESAYQQCMIHELRKRGIPFEFEVAVPIIYKGVEIGSRLKCDLLIENCLVVELKAIESILPVHEAQILTYMKLLEVPKGLMLNFNCVNLYKQGQKTYVNQLFSQLEE